MTHRRWWRWRRRRLSSRTVRIHDGRRSADDFRRLIEALDVVVEAELTRLEQAEEARFDRAAIRAAFDGAGFEDEYFGLDFGAPIEQFLAELEQIHTDDLPLYVQIYERYPTGLVEGPFISLDEMIKNLGLGPED